MLFLAFAGVNRHEGARYGRRRRLLEHRLMARAVAPNGAVYGQNPADPATRPKRPGARMASRR